MTLEYMDALEEALPELGADDNVRASFYRRGRGKFFVGMNLKQLGEGFEKNSFDAVLDQRLQFEHDREFEQTLHHIVWLLSGRRA